ncbi:uncharacterized protein LOC113332833 [Papaver somniferum]|uniref:uncharacterized protein LOC113332833 n=1 Tax=Papaver somniferum TaxID=3469 RepID=UPI000E6FB9FA|nr:uncharacterized protein LOC113332833 [Papaver somniferum]
MYDLHVLICFGITGIKTHAAEVKQCFIKLPTRNQILVCCDGASKGNPVSASFGFVARNEISDCTGASSRGLRITTNYLAKMMVLVVAGEWEVKKEYVEVCFSLDSKAVLKAFSNGKIPWIVETRWNNIKRNITNIIFRHSYREINFSADRMAKNGVLLARGTVLFYEEKPGFLGGL